MSSIAFAGLSSTENRLAISIMGDPYSYASEYTDSESGLQNLNARYYDSRLMRFIQRDNYPLLNRYDYAGGNPILYSDPSGHIMDIAIISTLVSTITTAGTLFIMYKANINIAAAINNAWSGVATRKESLAITTAGTLVAMLVFNLLANTINDEKWRSRELLSASTLTTATVLIGENIALCCLSCRTPVAVRI